MKRDRTPYQKGVEYLFKLQKHGIKFGLSKTENLLKALGNPHKGRKFVHIAGTNGKGSVAAFLASILREAGFRVGLYSSPHLVRFTERFRVNNSEMTPERAVELIEELRGVVAPDSQPTFFEAITAMALVHFAREDTDIDIMEVGMGGRLDATNLISPLVSVITGISLEHKEFLGPRLLDIAGEKAGIIKEDTDVVTGATQPAVRELLQAVCEKKSAPLWRLGKELRYRCTGCGLHYYGINHRLNRLHLGLKGNFQARNAALALGVSELLENKGFGVTSGDMREGLEKTEWPGRMQVVATDPLIVVDGAHNPAAIRALARAVESGFTYRRLILIIGMMQDKDIPGLLRGIVPISDYVFYTRPVYLRAAEPEILQRAAAQMGKPGEAVPVLAEAIGRAKRRAGESDLILICGSLFTVGEAMTYFDEKTYRPDGL
jgi:dihydrofolate synthase / folylpolyglutamate synthase